MVSKINRGQILRDLAVSQMKNDLPEFGPGDTIVVSNRITEGKKTRNQKFEGIVLRSKGSGASETAIVRKESNGV